MRLLMQVFRSVMNVLYEKDVFENLKDMSTH